MTAWCLVCPCPGLSRIAHDFLVVPESERSLSRFHDRCRCQVPQDLRPLAGLRAVPASTAAAEAQTRLGLARPPPAPEVARASRATPPPALAGRRTRATAAAPPAPASDPRRRPTRGRAGR